MSNKRCVKVMALLLAVLLFLTPSTISEAKAGFTGFKKEQGFSRYYSNGELVKNKVSLVDNGLYYSDKSGNITAEIMLNTGMKYKVVEKQAGYINAYYAASGIYSNSTVKPGEYYIHKIAQGSVNITSEKNTPGFWINPEESLGNLKKQFEGMDLESKTSVSAGGTFRVLKTLKGYGNSYDARDLRNPLTSVKPGNYFIFKTANGTINVSRSKTQPGSWINLKAAAAENVTIEVDANESNHDSDNSTPKLDVGDVYKLSKNVSGYTTAGYALTGQNPVTNVAPGSYYIYRTFRGSLNLTVKKGEPGSWVNPKEVGDSKVFEKGKEAEKEIKSDKKSLKIGSEYVVTKTLPGYINSDYAKAGINSNSRVTPGTYYVFAIAKNKAVNVTPVKSSPGFWIIPEGEEVDTNVAETSKPSKADDSKSKVNPVVIVIDPGHGAGIAHNRGGLLFNEGDQNYAFAQKVISKLKRYNNVVVKTTRGRRIDDPTLDKRAIAGAGADLFLSLHTNAAPISLNTKGVLTRGSEIRGVELYSSNYSSNTSMAYQITKMVSDTLNTPNRGVRFRDYAGSIYGRAISGATDYYGVFRFGNTAKTKYLIEFVFHTNLEDSRAFLNNQDALATRLVNIIADNYRLKK